MKLGTNEVTGIVEVVINRSVYNRNGYQNHYYWEHVNENTGIVTRVLQQDDMVRRIKKYHSNPSAHMWVSGNTINVRI